MIQSRRWFLRSTGVLTATAVLGGCSKQVSGTPKAGSTATSSSKPKPPVRGPVTLGVTEYQPYAHTDDDGELTGEVVEVCRAVMKSMGVDELDVEIMEFDSLLLGLNAERVDIVGGMAPNEERCAQASWSVPDHEVLTALVVQKGNPKQLKTFDEVISSGARLAVVTGSFEEQLVTRLGVPPTQVTPTPDSRTLMSVVASGQVDAATYDDITLRSLARNEGGTENLEVLPGFRPDGEDPWLIRFAFRDEDTELRDAFNDGLTELHDSGDWLDIAEKFDLTKDNRPDEDTDADEACGR